MKLPNNSVGPSDVIGWRDCPRRTDYSLERWTQGADHPEGGSYPAAMGSAFHDAVEYIEDHDSSDLAGLQHAVNKWGHWMAPEDIEELAEQIKVYRSREQGRDWALVGTEVEIRVPMFEIDGTTYSARGKIDKVYRSRSNPSHFKTIDFKTSRMPKSKVEVDEDIQQWWYAWLIREHYPECDILDQEYDQLRFGVLKIARKTDRDLASIRSWIERQMRAMIADETKGEDGRALPRLNDWCGSCSYVADCPIIPKLTAHALTNIALRAQVGPDEEPNEAQRHRGNLARYASDLPEVMNAEKALKNYVDAAKKLLLQATPVERSAFGFKTQTRAVPAFSDAARQRILEAAGPQRFAQAVNISEKQIKSLGLPPAEEAALLDLGVKTPGAPFIVADKKAKPKA